MATAAERKQKAVAVAQDVLKQLRRRKVKYKVKSSYVYVKSDYDLTVLDSDDDLQSHVDQIQEKECHVCALGAALLSKARIFDEVPVGYFKFGFNRGEIAKALKDTFTETNMDLIEAAFERRRICGGGTSKRSLDKAVSFGCQYLGDESRLQAIMQNIIDNEGVFKP